MSLAGFQNTQHLSAYAMDRRVFNHWRNLCAHRPRRHGSVQLEANLSGDFEHEENMVFFHLRDATFKSPLAGLWKSLRSIVTEKTSGVLLCQTWAIATLYMQFSFIKKCSYSGACLRWDRFSSKPLKGWRWYDPGNWAYAVIWHLIRKTARHWTAHHEIDDCRLRAARLQRAMNLAQQRFARRAEDGTNVGPRWEVLGDFCEMALARGYYYQDSEVIVLALSEIACMVLEVFNVLMNRCPRGHSEPRGYIEPMVYADALLMAACGHRHADFTSFSEFIANVQVFFPRDV